MNKLDFKIRVKRIRLEINKIKYNTMVNGSFIFDYSRNRNLQYLIKLKQI
jgi:hypothetical protein